MTTHNHKTVSQHEFSNTKSGWYEKCDCGAIRVLIPNTPYPMVISDWQKES